MTIPASKFGLMAEEYCKLFSKDGLRPDQLGDRGLEYRNVVGIPGGVKSPLAKVLVEASIATGDKLDFASGKGGARAPWQNPPRLANSLALAADALVRACGRRS